jgi:CheY-like chemotaxis protein
MRQTWAPTRISPSPNDAASIRPEPGDGAGAGERRPAVPSCPEDPSGGGFRRSCRGRASVWFLLSILRNLPIVQLLDEEQVTMSTRPQILLVDDDPDFLDLYREMFSQHLPSVPEVRTANSGSRALALLESEPFNLMVVDLNMPKMDGLQVLSIAGRKFPQLRLMVLTGMHDEQFRTRAYAMGVDQYWLKPETDHDMGLLMEAVESLLKRESQGGFRGVQSKSLVDIIQLECLSQSSSVLKISNGVVGARIFV